MKLSELASLDLFFANSYAHYVSEFAEEFKLNEGLVKSLSQTDFLSKLRSKFPGKVFEHSANVIGKFSFPNSVNDIERFCKLCGWFISGFYDDEMHPLDKNTLPDKLGRHPVLLVFEPYHSEEISTPTFLYPATPSSNWEKIKQRGLSPKSKSELAYHPERVYFTTSVNSILHLVKHLGYAKFINSDDTPHFNADTYFRNWAILKIDTTKIKNLGKLSYFKVHRDTKVDDDSALYSQNFVPPSAITLIKIVKI